MIHMTCKRTNNAKEDLAYVVDKFLKLDPVYPNMSRSLSDSHTQTVSPEKRHLQVFEIENLLFLLKLFIVYP